MNKRTLLGAVCAALLSAAAGAEQYYVATMTDFTGAKTFSVLTREQCKAKELEFKQQNALLPKVIAAIEADFRKNPEAHSGEKFYGRKLKPKTIKAAPAPDYEKAQAKVERLQEREDNKDLENDADKKGKKKKKLTDAEKEKAYEEAQRQYAIQSFAEEVERQIKEKIGEAAAK